MLGNLSFNDLPTPRCYAGPERRLQASPPTAWLVRMLDEIDHGMLLVTADGQLRHVNRPAQRELADGAVLKLSLTEVRTTLREQHNALQQSLAAAARGRRSLLSLGDAQRPLPVAVLPFGQEGLVLLMLGKRHHCEPLTMDFYARNQGLTEAEARVLGALCNGLRPKEVARRFDVSVSTVRTQITSIRHKTQTASIRDLVDRVNTLPPMATTLLRLGWSH